MPADPRSPFSDGASGAGRIPEVIDVEVVSARTERREDAHEDGGGHAGRFGGFGGGFHSGGVWFHSGLAGDPLDRWAPAVTLALFVVVLVRFGFLAGLGFLFFHLAGSAVGMYRNIRALTLGRTPHPRLWRLASWAGSFALAGWLSGRL